MNTHTAVVIAKIAIAGPVVAAGALFSGVPSASAQPVPTIDLADVADIDSLPVCAQEDCSDQPGQTGVWLDDDTGNWYLERGESYTRLIIDDTAMANFVPDACHINGWTWGVGDDNCDGVIMEDESGWDCRSMGNHVCGPGNVQGVPPGDYGIRCYTADLVPLVPCPLLGE